MEYQKEKHVKHDQILQIERNFYLRDSAILKIVQRASIRELVMFSSSKTIDPFFC